MPQHLGEVVLALRDANLVLSRVGDPDLQRTAQQLLGIVPLSPRLMNLGQVGQRQRHVRVVGQPAILDPGDGPSVVLLGQLEIALQVGQQAHVVQRVGDLRRVGAEGGLACGERLFIELQRAGQIAGLAQVVGHVVVARGQLELRDPRVLLADLQGLLVVGDCLVDASA